jgi:hypothetical protein
MDIYEAWGGFPNDAATSLTFMHGHIYYGNHALLIHIWKSPIGESRALLSNRRSAIFAPKELNSHYISILSSVFIPHIHQ